MRKKALVRGPALSRSGYGEHTRFVLRALRAYEEHFDIHLITTGWGQTGWLYEDNEERRWMDSILAKTIEHQQKNGQYDISFQVTIPNEWEKLASINIGVTAGIETTKVAPVWIEKASLMDQIITISNHSKSVYENTVYSAKHPQTEQEVHLKCKTPIHVVHYPVRNHKSADISLDFKTNFNFLTVAQWGPRKNIVNTVKWFVEEFIDKQIGLVLKLNIKNNSNIDKYHTEQTVESLLKEYPQRKCKVYLLHGDMTDEEMTALYLHPKIKALISITHGEGFGLPLFEAAYNALPILAVDWSGYCDFLYKAVEKNGRMKTKAFFAKIDYDLAPIPKEAVWEGVLQQDSQWCYAKQGSYKMKLREVRKDYGRFVKQAKELQQWLLENFTEKKQYEKFAQLFISDENDDIVII